MDNKSLKDKIKEAFPAMTEEDFGRHESDLYVRVVPGLREWLRKNYSHHQNVQGFTSQIDGTPWLDIPFAAWDERFPVKESESRYQTDYPLENGRYDMGDGYYGD